MSSWSSRRRHIQIVVIVLAALLAPASALAIPAFARRYHTSCTTCHVLFPKLNAFGVAFRNNGYRIPPNDESFVQVPDLALGAPAWKRVWPNAVWPGGIPALGPIAMRVVNDAVLNRSDPAQVDFVFPNEFELLAGGTAGDSISYFAELEVVAGKSLDDDPTRMERMFVQFDHLGGTTLANLVIGRFETRAVPFSRFHRRLIPSDILALDFRNPSDGLHLRRAQQGIEFWGAKSGRDGRGGIDYAVGVVNGSGPMKDNNSAKDVYTRLAYKFGGFGVTGSSAKGETLGLQDGWRDDSVKIGISSYFGKGNFTGGEDRFWRIGGDIDIFVGALNISAVALHGRDQIESIPIAERFTAASLELNYVIKPWVIAVFRCEGVWRDDAANIRRVVPGVAFAIRPNLRIVGDWEAYLDTSHEGVRTRSGDSRARIRLDIAF